MRSALGVVALLALTACSSGGSPTPTVPAASAGAPASSASPATASATATLTTTPDAAPANVYAGTDAGDLAPAARAARPLVYVPNTLSNTLQVIDPRTYRVIARYPTGREPQHVVPSWDLKTLWVNDDLGNDLVPVNPRTGRTGRPVPVADPYNLYFTPDGAARAGDGRAAAPDRRPRPAHDGPAALAARAL